MSPEKFIYKCTDCGKEFDIAEVIYLCPFCSSENTTATPPKGILKIHYDYQQLRKKLSGFDELKNKGFIDLLPIETISSLPKLRIGKTPLYKVDKLNGEIFPFRIHLKDDSQNPTYSFKDRASALVSAFASEKNLDVLVTASTGNAGSSLAGICASKNQKAVIIIPETAPAAKLTQIIMYGATIIPVRCTYDEAFDLSCKATEEFGWYNRNTAFNPLTIEGKKSVSFELIEDLGFKVPDTIFVPVGDGVIISGVYKGFEDLYKLSFIDKMPVIVAVQSKGSDNLVRNLSQKDFQVVHSSTVADSISVDIPRNFFMTQQFMQMYDGESITVSDTEIIEASAILSENTGLFAEPAGAAAFAGMLSYLKSGKISENSDNVVLLTGSGLKDLNAVSSLIRIPESIYPSVENLKSMLNDNIFSE
jgi:threonine synthase